MKKSVLKFSFLFVASIMLSSCYTYEFSVGEGAQTGIQKQKKNHYLIAGLAPVSVSDPAELAGDAKDYDVKIQHTFVDGLINGLTFGLYTPTTTKVTR